MARGWGRNEEDLAADKEQAAAERAGFSSRRPDSDRVERLRAIEMDLARIEEQLTKTTNPARRAALEKARAELLERRTRAGS